MNTKKIIKICIIASVIVVALGIGILTLGLSFGGYKSVENMAENGELSFFGGRVRLNPPFVGDAGVGFGWFDEDSIEDADLFAGEDKLAAPEAPKTPAVPGSTVSGNTTTGIKKPSKPSKPVITSAKMVEKDEVMISIEEVDKIQVELGVGQLYIESGDVDNIQVITNCKDEFRVYVENNIFCVEGFGTREHFFGITDWNADENVARIVVPYDLVFEETSLSLGAGFVQFKNMTLGETEMEVGAGEVDCQNTESDHLSADVGAGVLRMSGIKTGKTDVTVAMGEISLSGAFSDDVDVTCAMGSAEITVDSHVDEFDYEISAAMGAVEVDGEKYDGLLDEKRIDNGAGKTISAEADMGDIVISFMK